MFDTAPVLDCAGRRLTLDRVRVMGVVNVTPDSFSDGGRHADTAAAIAHGLALVEQGADLLDVGGESTRPGATPVDEATELARVIPVIEALAARAGVPISIDTRKPVVMRAALAAGAGMVNDVSALGAEGALELVAASGAAVVLMHMQGDPVAMQHSPHYDDVQAEVRGFLAGRVLACEMAGIARNRLVVDPGFGFGKTLEHNLALLAGLGQLVELGLPVLVGLSHKSCLGAITGRAVGERSAASLAAHLIAAMRGARIVRVHEVAATVDALKVLAAVEAMPLARAAPVRAMPRWPDED